MPHFFIRFCINLNTRKSLFKGYFYSFPMALVRRRTNFNHLSEFDKRKIIGFQKAGLSFVEITNHMNRNRGTVWNCWTAWTEGE